MCGMATLWGVNIHFHIQKSMFFKIIAKNRFQHVTHHNYTISPRPQHMYDTLSYCPCCTFCILFLFCNLMIWISTLFAWMFFGLPRKDLMRLAFELAEEKDLQHPFNKEQCMVVKKWCYNFLKRHPARSHINSQSKPF